MSNFDTNKYRFRVMIPNQTGPQQTEAHRRGAAIRRIASALAKNWGIASDLKFNGKAMSDEHEIALLDAAKVLNKLVKLEQES